MAAEQQLIDFSFRWDRSFPGVDLPDLNFLNVLKDPSGSEDEVSVALEDERKSLGIQEETLQKQLDQVRFCLTWIREATVAKSEDICEENGLEAGAGNHHQPSGNDHNNGASLAERSRISDKKRLESSSRTWRSSSLAGEGAKELKSWQQQRWTSDNGCEHRTKDDVMKSESIRGKDRYYENVTMSKSLDDVRPMNRLPPRPATYPQSDQEATPVRRSVHSADFTEILRKLCDHIPIEKEASVLTSLRYSSYANVRLLDRLLYGTTVTETNTELLIWALQSVDLGHLVKVLKNGKQRSVDPKPPLRKRPSDLLLNALSRQRANSESDCPSPGDCPSPLTPSGDAFFYGIKIIRDYRPSSGSSEPSMDEFRRFILVRGQHMDVIGLFDGEAAGEQYVARNTETEMGLVPKDKCDINHEATPIIWQKEWFVTSSNVKHYYSELMAKAPTGTFYIRNCSHKNGDFCLVVKTGKSMTKFQIKVDKSYYSITSRSSGPRSFLSLDGLIAFYKTHSLTVEDQTNICLTIPCKMMDGVPK